MSSIISQGKSPINLYQVNHVQNNQMNQVPATNATANAPNRFIPVTAYNNQSYTDGSNLNSNSAFRNVNPFYTPNQPNNNGVNSTVFSELDAIDRLIGPNSLISIHRTPDGKPDGLTVQYDPRIVGRILLELARRPEAAGIIGKLRSLLGNLEAGRYQGLKVYTADDQGIPRESGILSSASTAIGSTQQIMASSTQGFNPFSRGAEVILAWLDVLAMDPSTIQGDFVTVAGTRIPRTDLETLNDALKQNPEIPKALEQFTGVLKIYNDRQKANIDAATSLRGINAKLVQPGDKAGGGAPG
jgi:hypothetical protein